MGIKIGSLRMWHNRNGVNEFHAVGSPEEAMKLIDSLSASDLKDDSVSFNAFGLEVYDESTGRLGWSEWYKDGEDIIEIMDKL